MRTPALTPQRRTRLATLERQLQRYLDRCAQMPAVQTPAQAKRRATLQRRVIQENLRRQRCLRERGTEQGWQAMPLPPIETSDMTPHLDEPWPETPEGV